MKPQHQVITPDQAKEFKELGIAQQKSLCVWAYQCMSSEKLLHINNEDLERTEHDHAAFTSAELGIMFKVTGQQLPLINTANYEFGRANTSGDIISSPIEAHARAAFLINHLQLLRSCNKAQFEKAINEINSLLNN